MGCSDKSGEEWFAQMKRRNVSRLMKEIHRVNEKFLVVQQMNYFLHVIILSL